MKFRKVVKYEGRTIHQLVKGKLYTVKDIDFQTNAYTLEGVEGKFAASIFTEVKEEELPQKPAYIAFASQMPELGKEHFIVRIDKGNIQPVRISTVKDISYVEDNIYRIETENSVYMTQITA